MKIRKSISETGEQKVYIYENKKEEFFIVSLPDIEWSISFLYEDINIREKLLQSLVKKMDQNEAEILSSRILQWTNEM